MSIFISCVHEKKKRRNIFVIQQQVNKDPYTFEQIRGKRIYTTHSEVAVKRIQENTAKQSN